eukprot:4587882-Lingulodinium_polyedra.AAC.1
MAQASTVVAERFLAAFGGEPLSSLVVKRARVWPCGGALNIVFSYADFLLSGRAPASRAISFKEAMNFATGFVGFRGA